MTCIWRTWSPEAAEDDTLRPDLRRVERVEIFFPNDELERIEQTVPRDVLFDRDNVDTHRHNVQFNLFRRDADVDSSDVAINGYRRSTPRHGAATWLLADNYVFVPYMIRFHSFFRGSYFSTIS